jgi:hypothetical protein
MSDNVEKKVEEVPVTRKADEAALAKQSATFLSSLTNTANLPADPEEQVDEITRRMNTLIRSGSQLSRVQKKMARETLSALVLKAQTLSISSHERHIENLYVVANDIRKRQLIKLWLDFVKKEGASTVASLNSFVLDWEKYCKAEMEKAKNSGLDEGRVTTVSNFILQNEQDMLDDIRDVLTRFRQQNREQQTLVEGQVH